MSLVNSLLSSSVILVCSAKTDWMCLPYEYVMKTILSDVKTSKGSITTKIKTFKKNGIHSNAPTGRQTGGLKRPVFSGLYME